MDPGRLRPFRFNARGAALVCAIAASACLPNGPPTGLADGGAPTTTAPKKKRSLKWVWIAAAAVVVVGGAVTAGLLLGLNNGKLRFETHTPPAAIQ